MREILFRGKRADNGESKRRKDITGMMFGNVQAVRFSHIDKGGNAHWVFRCGRCKNDYIAAYGNIRRSKNPVCKNCKNELLREKQYKHGGEGSRLYAAWCHMKSRCYCKTSRDYKYWGGRGITVCDEWIHNYDCFKNWALNNGYDDSLTIDRIDNDKGYSPNNCRWITIQEQQHNKRKPMQGGKKIA